MSRFNNANNISISGGVFTNVRGDQVHYHLSDEVEGRKEIEILATKIAPGAFHDGAGREQRPKCHPDTRKEVLDQIMDRIHETHVTSEFLWIYGPAGAGKTAISGTVAEICHAELG
ncbi:hypothetical protein M413DRAFT_269126 [Hebeloma cylindrosporum]|uniref:Uncharacterized protein n=1 Tax=Hebeloma cylindrosporum TaxID=76867 RepID=A0A0C3CE73_HEBCY|nr:hypothetical protein M413DRAFT_269126 [Hebeloma cylindrosporum h7]